MKILRRFLFAAMAVMFVATQAQAVMFFARAYDPNLQRWIQRDRIGETGGLNLYEYVGNNPIGYVDPLGFQIASPANFALGWSAPPGYESQWNSQFQAANAQALPMEAGALAGVATGGAIMAAAPAGVAAFAGGYPLAAGAGAASGYVGNGVANTLSGQPFNQNAGTAAGLGAALGVGGKAVSDLTKPPCPSKTPNISSNRGGNTSADNVAQIKAAMQNNTYDYTAPRGRIGGYMNDAGEYQVGEGNHRMQAAMQIYQETGDPSAVLKLIENGSWTKVSQFPTPALRLPPPK